MRVGSSQGVQAPRLTLHVSASPCQGNRAPWVALEDLQPTDTSNACEKALFFVYFVCFVVPTLRGVEAPGMAS